MHHSHPGHLVLAHRWQHDIFLTCCLQPTTYASTRQARCFRISFAPGYDFPVTRQNPCWTAGLSLSTAFAHGWLAIPCGRATWWKYSSRTPVLRLPYTQLRSLRKQRIISWSTSRRAVFPMERGARKLSCRNSGRNHRSGPRTGWTATLRDA